MHTIDSVASTPGMENVRKLTADELDAVMGGATPTALDSAFRTGLRIHIGVVTNNNDPDQM
jgi:hypothetical protein